MAAAKARYNGTRTIKGVEAREWFVPNPSGDIFSFYDSGDGSGHFVRFSEIVNGDDGAWLDYSGFKVEPTPDLAIFDVPPNCTEAQAAMSMPMTLPTPTEMVLAFADFNSLLSIVQTEPLRILHPPTPPKMLV